MLTSNSSTQVFLARDLSSRCSRCLVSSATSLNTDKPRLEYLRIKTVPYCCRKAWGWACYAVRQIEYLVIIVSLQHVITVSLNLWFILYTCAIFLRLLHCFL